MKPPPGYERKLAKIASREDRFLVGRDMWTERDWRVQREQDAEKRARRAKLIASLDPPADHPVPPPPWRASPCSTGQGTTTASDGSLRTAVLRSTA